MALSNGSVTEPAADKKRKRRLKGTRKERVTQLVKEIERNLDIQKSRVTLADFIRLMQLERELEQEEQPREIIVTWKDPADGHSDASK